MIIYEFFGNSIFTHLIIISSSGSSSSGSSNAKSTNFTADCQGRSDTLNPIHISTKTNWSTKRRSTIQTNKAGWQRHVHELIDCVKFVIQLAVSARYETPMLRTWDRLFVAPPPPKAQDRRWHMWNSQTLEVSFKMFSPISNSNSNSNSIWISIWIYPTGFHARTHLIASISRWIYFVKHHHGGRTKWEWYQCVHCRMPSHGPTSLPSWILSKLIHLSMLFILALVYSIV